MDSTSTEEAKTFTFTEKHQLLKNVASMAWFATPVMEETYNEAGKSGTSEYKAL